MTITTQLARQNIRRTLDDLAVFKRIGDADVERKLTIEVVRYLEAMKRSHTASDGALAARIDKFIHDRDYDAAIQAWEGRR
jgi:hypothetical protein